MTKSTITREQAQKIIVAADEVITALAGNNEDVHPDDSKKMCDLWDDLNDRYAPPEVVRELARMALAAMDSEPVAYIFKHPAGRLFWALTDESNKCQSDVMPVYAAPQPAPVVPEEKPMPNTLSMYAVDAVAAIAEVRGWNACRAAMLQAEPVTTANKLGNSPVVPDGYVMVPKVVTPEISNAINEVGHRCTCGNCSQRLWDLLLAAAPQEVKGE
ncbi:hypothetical protein ACUF8H_000275 [Klebsiella aerogenes]